MANNTTERTGHGNGGKVIKKNVKVEFDGANLKMGNQVLPMWMVSKDGWANILTGIGVAGKDKRLGADAIYKTSLNERQCEEVYGSEAIARKICERLPYDGTRKWIKFDDDDNKIQADIERLDVRAMTFKGWKYARLYGGSALFINTGEPNEDLKNPLDYKKIQEIKSFVIMTRFELQTSKINSTLASPNFNNPETYLYTPRSLAETGKDTPNNVEIHHSRLIRFDGVELPELLRVSNDYWGDSIYTSIYDALRDFGMSYNSVASIIQDFRMLVYQVEGLARSVAAGQENQIKRRLELMNLSRSVQGSFLLDKDESMNSMSANVSGLDKLLEGMKLRLQAATDMPHTILFNQSPSGLGATGRSEERVWYDHVSAQQEIYLAPKLDQILKVMFSAKNGPTNGAEPKDWSYEFESLWQLSEKEAAEVYKMNMEGDKGYAEMGVLESDEITEKRFPDLAEEPK
jgi:phage-related protein (TIGR01555 family)